MRQSKKGARVQTEIRHEMMFEAQRGVVRTRSSARAARMRVKEAG
jgi:hypothetical protein